MATTVHSSIPGAGLLSIITPAHGAGIEYLADAYASICAQRMPEGWQWEWLIQEDGTDGAVAAHVPGDERIITAGGRYGGPATARNLALARSHGSIVKNLDADDQLRPGALARDIEVMTAHPGIGWTASGAVDLLPDGTTVAFDDVPDDGPLDRDEVFDFWLNHDHRLPVHPATLCIRRDLVVMLGGWMALPASEDTGLLIAASITSDGYFIAEPGLLYRKWPGQLTGRPEHHDPAERAARISLIKDRGAALRRQRVDVRATAGVPARGC